ncbi:MAG: tRNA 2-thiouridine(34) synthase MnmA [bacterium]|nr:tRNA 2-thiouridine(34) synthase MnmA [bacterium]
MVNNLSVVNNISYKNVENIETKEISKEEIDNLLQQIKQNLDYINKDDIIAVGLSGGVDSSTTLLLLKLLGFKVIGLTMKIWDEKYNEIFKFKADNKSNIHGCFGPEEFEDIQDCIKLTKHLNIDYYVIDLTQEYENIVLNYFKEEYLNGRTPNPCVMCNWKMKFEYLLEKAINSNIKFDYFATGHYVKKIKYNNQFTLQKANYLKKDQTYYLSFLNQKHLEKSIFPLGLAKSKEQVRLIAKYYNLPTYNKIDSQNFISTNYIEIFKNEQIENGIIVDKYGNILGKHKGVHNYTIGQRKHIGIPSSKRLYVISINKEENKIIVGEKEDLYQSKFIVKNLNWIINLDEVEKINNKEGILVKIRYTHNESPATLSFIEKNKVLVEFKEKQLAITPGQISVFYHNDILLGAGIIDRIIF